MAKLAHLKFNDLAPDVELQSIEGEELRLSTLWQDNVLLLAFTRHFGCPQCKEMIDQLMEIMPDLAQKGFVVTIVTQADLAEAKIFCNQRAPGVICLSDPYRHAYTAYGLRRGNVFQTLLSPRIWRSNRQLKKRKGWSPEMPPEGQDAFVMSGTFIIGPDGRIRLPYYYEDIADHPSFELLIKGIMGTDWNKPLEGPIIPNL